MKMEDNNKKNTHFEDTKVTCKWYTKKTEEARWAFEDKHVEFSKNQFKSPDGC